MPLLCPCVHGSRFDGRTKGVYADTLIFGIEL